MPQAQRNAEMNAGALWAAESSIQRASGKAVAQACLVWAAWGLGPCRVEPSLPQARHAVTAVECVAGQPPTLHCPCLTSGCGNGRLDTLSTASTALARICIPAGRLTLLARRRRLGSTCWLVCAEPRIVCSTAQPSLPLLAVLTSWQQSWRSWPFSLHSSSEAATHCAARWPARAARFMTHRRMARSVSGRKHGFRTRIGGSCRQAPGVVSHGSSSERHAVIWPSLAAWLAVGLWAAGCPGCARPPFSDCVMFQRKEAREHARSERCKAPHSAF